MNALCQKPYQKTHVWNLENQRHVTLPRQQSKTMRSPRREAEAALTELDWKQGRRMDSYFIEGATQTIIREEIYKKTWLQKRSMFHTKDFFSISMRNVNERILNERSVVVPAKLDTFMSREEVSSFGNSEQDFHQESSVVRLQLESHSYTSDGPHQEDMDTVVTDVEENDSIENGEIVRELCSDHVGECQETSRWVTRLKVVFIF